MTDQHWFLQVKAVCAPPVKLAVTNALTCQAEISPAGLLSKVNLANSQASFRGAAPSFTVTAPTTVYAIQPLPTAADYIFDGGITTPITLTATTPGVVPSVDSCQTSVTVSPLTPPTALCTPALTLPATVGCAAHPTATDLLGLIDAGSTVGSGGPLTRALDPPPASGVYTLPLGTFTISLTVSNCAGASTCSTLVTVADQEPLDVSPPSRCSMLCMFGKLSPVGHCTAQFCWASLCESISTFHILAFT